MKRFLPVVLLAAVACGCATHYKLSEPLTLAKSGLVNDPKQVSAIERAMTDDDLAMLLDADIRAKLPTALAVAGVDSSRYGVKALGAEELNQWEKVVADVPHVRGVQAVSSLVLGEGRATLHELRTAAAKMNCELLLVYLQSESGVDNYNEAAALYWTFVGLWLVPGNVYEHRTVLQAVILDTRTGAILGTATGDCHLTRPCPAAYGQVQQDKLRKEAPEKAMADLQKGCTALLKKVVAAAKKPVP